jgi:hypothetical protein
MTQACELLKGQVAGLSEYVQRGIWYAGGVLQPERSHQQAQEVALGWSVTAVVFRGERPYLDSWTARKL